MKEKKIAKKVVEEVVEAVEKKEVVNKSDLVDMVAEKAELKKIQAQRAVSAILESISEIAKADKKLSLVGFGSFESVVRAAHDGVNPQTQERIHIPAKKAFKFKPAKSLKDMLNEAEA